MQHTFKDVFGEGIGYAIKDASIDSAFVLSCDLDINRRMLAIKLHSNTYISEETVFALKQEKMLKKVLMLLKKFKSMLK